MSYGERMTDFIEDNHDVFDELNEKINELHDRITRCNNYVHGRFDSLRTPNQFILLKYWLGERPNLERIYVNLDNIAFIEARDREHKTYKYGLRFKFNSGQHEDYYYAHALNRDSELQQLLKGDLK